MLPLGNQTLMNGTGGQGDAVPADLITEVLAGDADRPRAGWLEDIPLQVIPLFWMSQVTGNGHKSTASTPVLVTVGWWVKESVESLLAKSVTTCEERP